ncbi:hypothetical protein D8S78_08110 [Natrialba swarupiae]|nr:hypothetical protein [Natrialba swarupiae]
MHLSSSNTDALSLSADGRIGPTSTVAAGETISPIVATESHCTPDRQTDGRSVCESFQLLL